MTGVKILLIILASLFLLEIALRSLFGFGNPLVYITDSQIGYLLAPNQQTRRFGNRIQINQYSMRGSDISPTCPAATLRILLLGDSIANGGWWTDQNDIISALLQRELKQELTSFKQAEFQQVEVLNASANSWSPRNELSYLQKYGTFSAQMIVLLINTDDLFGTAPTSLPVGRDRNYPKHKPPLALVEVITRYLIKPKPIAELAAVQQEGGDRVGFNLAAIEQIQTIASESQSKFLLVMTPLLRELGEPGSRDYEQKARQRLDEFTQQNQIEFIDFLPIFNAAPQPQALYRDHIHLSPAGNQLVTQRIIQSLSNL